MNVSPCFLDQNRLGTEQEEIYRRAIARFSDKSWYDKLARFYLRYKRDSRIRTVDARRGQDFPGQRTRTVFQST